MTRKNPLAKDKFMDGAIRLNEAMIYIKNYVDLNISE